MRYSTEPKYRKYVKGYSFLSFARNFGDKYYQDYTYQGLLQKNGLKFMVNQEKITESTKKLELKNQC